MPKARTIFLLSFATFFLFTIFSYFVAREVFIQPDFDTTVRLQDNIPQRLDDHFSFLSDIGKFEISTIVLIVLLILSRNIIFGIVSFLSYGMFHVIELFGKTYVDQLPPPEFMLRTKHIIEFPEFHVRADFSYPSGHSGRAAFLTVIAVYLILTSKMRKELKIALIALIAFYDIAMFVSRPYLGEHWTSDVAGGIFLGSSLALFAVAIGRLQFRRPKKNAIAST